MRLDGNRYDRRFEFEEDELGREKQTHPSPSISSKINLGRRTRPWEVWDCQLGNLTAGKVSGGGGRQDLGFIPSGNVVLSSTYVGKILGADQLLVILCYRYQESGIRTAPTAKSLASHMISKGKSQSGATRIGAWERLVSSNFEVSGLVFMSKGSFVHRVNILLRARARPQKVFPKIRKLSRIPATVNKTTHEIGRKETTFQLVTLNTPS
ncbi:hypothetical protein Tco_0120779 [Tanacetum coccineum]